MHVFGAESTAEDVTEDLDLTGTTWLITGVNSGLGRESARVMAAKGARILGAARTEAKAATALGELGIDGVPLACELSDLESFDEGLHRRVTAALSSWPETELVSWIEATAEPGSTERPRYRYYLTRSRQLLAVRDLGDAGKELFALDYAAADGAMLPPELDPFAGVH